ncbi:MAG: prepilin-type N-terminal cleavage/methylation domain-containing protein [Candidatus Gracilibacteria bacterium]|nr:prepilin-type N-terminal cleavage/methylation domain-containing protein [Candidatus Gracilibacteria bacterium]MDD2909031.1 prepilin-type N-terminal cleavage/methylation domain-containing protein [Candidatus Gracilibacteria bacterium]
MKTKNYQLKTIGFTLVELIVVIVILAILSTIAFLSFNSYSSSSRDTVRLTDISNSRTALELYITKASKYPIPDEAVLYTGNTGSVISQGVLGDNVARNIGLSKAILDPLTQSNYTYSTFGNGLYYQIASSLENDSSISYNNGVVEFNKGLSENGNNIINIPALAGITKLEFFDSILNDAFFQTVNAVDSSTSSSFKTTKVEGNYKIDPSLPSLIVVPSSVNSNSGIFDPNVCFVMDSGVNTTSSGLIVNTVDSSSGTCAKKKDMSLKDYDNSLVGYWDMETTFNSGGIDYLKDLSGNGKIGSGFFGIGIGDKEGLIGKSTGFNGTNQYFKIDNFYSSGEILNEITISALVKVNTYNPSVATPFISNWHTWSIGNQKGYLLRGFSPSTSRFESDFCYYTNYYTMIGPNSAYNDFNNQYSNKWLFLTSAYSQNGTIKIYLNGMIIGQSKNNLPYKIFTDTYLFFGRSIINSGYLNGIIDDVKIYNRALSDSEISQQAKIAGF